MAMVKLDEQLNNKLVRYETLMDEWVFEYMTMRIWMNRLIYKFKVTALAKTIKALVRSRFIHTQLSWLVRHDQDVADYNHLSLERMNA